MSKVRIYGDVSGYVDIAVPDNAGTTTLNLDKIPQADINGNIAMDTNTLYVDAANNRVGVGTASPNTALDIVSPSGAEAINIRGRSADDIGQLKFYENDGTTSLARLDSRTTHFEVGSYNELRFSAGGVGNSHVVIDTSGNVGIGATSPDVFSRGYTRTLGITSSGSTSLAIQSSSDPQYPAIEMGRGASRQFIITNQAAYSTIGTLENTPLRFLINGNEALRMDTSRNLIINQSAGSTDNVAIRITGGASGYSNVQFSDPDDVNVGMIQYNHASNYMQFTTNDAEAMRIRSSRAVSISTNGYVKNDAAQHLTIGDGTSASSASLSVVRGEGLSGGTGPTISLYHGPDSGTQVQHIIASYIGDLLISADHQNIHSGTTIEFNIDGSRKLLLNGAGNLVMNSGSGIDFSATGNGSGTTTSELLDDYEEGTWTPGVSSGTISAINANYTKIGRSVTVSALIYNISDQSSSNVFTITNLPFASCGTCRQVGSIMMRYQNNTSLTAAYITQNTTNVEFYGVVSGGWDVALYSDWNNINAEVYFTVTYQAT
jgi:hypothetical protein